MTHSRKVAEVWRRECDPRFGAEADYFCRTWRDGVTIEAMGITETEALQRALQIQFDPRPHCLRCTRRHTHNVPQCCDMSCWCRVPVAPPKPNELLVGTDGKGHVIMVHPNLDLDDNNCGHIVFSIMQAADLAALLFSKCSDAAKEL